MKSSSGGGVALYQFDLWAYKGNPNPYGIELPVVNMQPWLLQAPFLTHAPTLPAPLCQALAHCQFLFAVPHFIPALNDTQKKHAFNRTQGSWWFTLTMRSWTLATEERALIFGMSCGGIHGHCHQFWNAALHSADEMKKGRLHSHEETETSPSKIVCVCATRDLGRLVRGDRHQTLRALAHQCNICRNMV